MISPRTILSAAVVTAAWLAPVFAWGQEGTPVRPAEAKSGTTATLWSVGATLVPLAIAIPLGNAADDGPALDAARALVVSGLVLGPAAGYWYGDRAARGTLGAVLRAGVLVATIAAVDDDEEWDIAADVLGVLIGTGVTAASATWDIVFVHRHVRNRNRALGLEATLVPSLGPDGEPRCVLSVRF